MFFHGDKSFILYGYSRFIADLWAIGNYIQILSNLRAAKNQQVVTGVQTFRGIAPVG